MGAGFVCARASLFFVPPSALLASLALVVWWPRLAPRALPRARRATRWLACCCCSRASSFVSTMGMLYRATKPLVAPLVLALFLLALAEHRAPRLRPRRRLRGRLRDRPSR